mmetsp:Transcript_17566/g.19555  ORF Transcript_17566/g.19555 Transcript_17566/m.19555 type:complete len:224 (-) Transcript_17566:85-756(-)
MLNMINTKVLFVFLASMVIFSRAKCYNGAVFVNLVPGSSVDIYIANEKIFSNLAYGKANAYDGRYYDIGCNEKPVDISMRDSITGKELASVKKPLANLTQTDFGLVGSSSDIEFITNVHKSVFFWDCDYNNRFFNLITNSPPVTFTITYQGQSTAYGPEAYKGETDWKKSQFSYPNDQQAKLTLKDKIVWQNQHFYVSKYCNLFYAYGSYSNGAFENITISGF